MNMSCPNDIFVDADPGSTGVMVDYASPTATTDCVCPGVQISLQQGLLSGELFPIGVSTVCYTAKDSCGSGITCCFTVTVTEQTACDVKTISCIQYELLGISQNAALEKNYRIRVKNNCQQPLVYFAAQLPNGMVAEAPLNNTTYTSPTGRGYTVRNPNYSPFYSIRFMSQADSISGGESDVFQYTLPPQADPDYIHVIVRIKEQIFHEAYLNTFNCPVQYGPILPPGDYSSARLSMHLYPNPSEGQLYLDAEQKPAGMATLRVLDAQGRLVYRLVTEVNEDPISLSLPADMPSGLFILDVRFADGSSWAGRFVKE